MTVEESYRLCDGLARQKARNFYYGFRLLPRPRRLALSAMYAFFRACDDLADGGESVAERTAALQDWRAAMERALDPGGGTFASPILPAFRDAVERFHIPLACFRDLIDGACMDQEVHAYETFDDLYRYCYRVASTVGLVCVHVFGFDGSPEALQQAEWCGIAFQITNILRDVDEDAGLGRIYLPQEDLRRFGLTSEDLQHAVFDDRFRALMAFEAARAHDFYARSADLAGHIAAESRGAFQAMAGIYHALLEKLEREDFRVYGRRVSLSRLHKLALLGRALLGLPSCVSAPRRIP